MCSLCWLDKEVEILAVEDSAVTLTNGRLGQLSVLLTNESNCS